MRLMNAAIAESTVKHLLHSRNTVFGHVKFLSATQIEILHNSILGMIFSTQALIGYS
jgi:hypothetical protein